MLLAPISNGGTCTNRQQSSIPPPDVTLTFQQAVVRKSKQLVDTNGNATQTFTNTLLADGAAVTAGAAYRISANPGGYTSEEISVDASTGTVSFTKALYDKMTPSDPAQPTGPPAVITIEATHRGKTASYTFTVTDHFSPRRYHASAALSGALYVIGGFDGTDSLNDVWKSTDGGVTWTNVHAGF